MSESSVVHRQSWATILLLSLLPQPLWAEADPLPEPLTLTYALQQASADHPQLQIANAGIARARAQGLQVEADNGLAVTLSARLRWIEPQPSNIDQSHDDHRLSLFVDKPLYDFGRSSAKEQASHAALQGSEQLLRDALNRHRIAIMAAFFDVLLADQAYARDTETMTMNFLRYDRARQRNELGQLSDIDLMEKRSLFQAARVLEARSIAAQRTTRARLANLLNRPGQLPSELQAPQVDNDARHVPEDVEPWLTQLEQGNPLLLSMQAQQARARAQLALAQAEDQPQLTGRLELSEYTRDFGGNDVWRAGVQLDVPLLTGGRSDALQARQRAELQQISARLEQQRRDLRQTLLELWSELQSLRMEQQQLAAEQDFRELYLDRSRARYELEVASDLGDSMVRISELQYRVLKNRFATALAWAQLDALLGITPGDRDTQSIKQRSKQ
ncbi:MAG TPA: hypothetical protein ENI97_02165 [Gammaproteobacteria bacterium]|nr:hypothetical protein [Gammaproteobacteria bacterium]